MKYETSVTGYWVASVVARLSLYAKAYWPPSVDARRRSGDRCGAVGRGRDVAGADLDLGDAQVLGLAGVGVADGALPGLDRADDAGRALSGLAALGRPGVGRLGGPVGLRGLAEVVGEVGRGAGLVRAVDRRDGRVGQGDARVDGRDRRVVPVGDLAAEDLRDQRRRELQVRHAGEVVDDRDRRDVDGHLDVVARAAALRLRDLVAGDVAVAARVVDAATLELGASRAGAARVVVDRGVRVGVLEAGHPRLGRGLLGARARAGDGARDSGRRRTGGGTPGRRRLVGCAAACEDQGAGGGDAHRGESGTGTGPQGLHVAFLFS